jgi:hypothetical protein
MGLAAPRCLESGTHSEATLLGLVGTFGNCRGRWADRRTLLQQMLIHAAPGIAADAAAATGFFALTDSRCDDPEVVTGRSLATPTRFIQVCPSWRSLPHACAVIACTSAVPALLTDHLPPFTTADHRFVAFHYGDRPVPEGGCPRLGTGDGDRAADILCFVAASMGRGLELADVLDRTTGPITIAVLHHAARTVIIAHRGQTLWLSRPRGDPCWFLTTGRHVVAEAFQAVLGPQYPYSDLCVPIADESLLTIHLDHNTPVVSGSTTVRTK